MSGIIIVNDCEFSGSKINTCFMVSWGSIAADALTGQILEKHIVHFSRPGGKDWESNCLEQFWLKPIPSNATQQKKEMQRALYDVHTSVERNDIFRVSAGFGTQLKVDWINEMSLKYAKNNPSLVTFISDTSSADNTWINYYLSQIDHEPLHCFFKTSLTYHYKDVLSTSAWAQGAAGISVYQANCILTENGRFSEDKTLREYFNIPDEIKPTIINDHDPVNDCINMLEEHFIHLKYVNQAKERALAIERRRVLNNLASSGGRSL